MNFSKGRTNSRGRRAKAEAPAPENYFNMKVSLNTGSQMPIVGFGTNKIIKAGDVFLAVEQALQAGYRMFDTAPGYSNEINLKKAFDVLLPRYGLEREDIFVTAKVTLSDRGGLVDTAYNKTLENLGMDYVDLYFIQNPGPTQLRCNDQKVKEWRENTWASLEALYDDGLVNAIGVSNFTIKDIDELLMTNQNVVPAVNQVDWHPFIHQDKLPGFCKSKDIILQANCSLGGTSADENSMLEDPVVKKIAAKMNVTSSQLLLVWSLQQDVAVVPKSTIPEIIKYTSLLNFVISDEDLKALNLLVKTKKTK